MTVLAEQTGWSFMTERLPDLDDVQLQQWSDLVERRTGVMIPPERKAFLATGLRARMREAGVTDYDSYFHMLNRSQRWSQEWSNLVDRLTVHETSFFRHEPSLRLLREEVLPAFGVANKDCSRSFQAWSLGCSTGEEPYTLAMTIHEYLAEKCKGQMFGVTATDISQPSISYARRGIYSARRVAGIPESLRKRYCTDMGDGSYRIAEKLRRRICFAQLNVMHLDGFPLRNLDLIFCQNMLIYFARERRTELLNAVCERLVPGGVLVVGPGDVLAWSHPEFERIRFEGTLAFRRRALATANE